MTVHMQISELLKEINENPIPVSPIFIEDDVTEEKMGIIMTENSERLGIFSAEGGPFANMAGKYSNKGGNFDLPLKSHTGDPWSCQRVGREPRTMQSPSLTICTTIQSQIIDEIGSNTQFTGRGLVARFLWVKGKSQVGYRARQTKSIPENLADQYNKHITSLMDISLTPRIFKLTEEAQALWDEFYNETEKEMRPGGSLEGLQDWGSKLPGAVARIAGLLHFAEHGVAAETLPISVTSVTASCRIGAYYSEHAIATFGMMREDPRMKAAKQILNYILKHKPENFKGRDVIHHTNLKTMDDILPGMNILIERGFIREVKAIYSGMGRPVAESYDVNPKLNIQKNP